MSFFLQNPWGLLGLIGAGPIIYFHFFRRQTRRQVVNTLFLLKKATVNRKAGDQLSRWRQSSSFWLQILLVILLTWLLAQPRWLSDDKSLRVVFTLDSSLSMSAFRDSVVGEIDKHSRRIQNVTPAVEWILMETANDRGSLYRGRDRGDLIATAANWQPRLGGHSFAEALRQAHHLASESGIVILVSDRKTESVPIGTNTAAVGSKISNVGITGIQAYNTPDGPSWRALIKNFSEADVETNWWIESDSERSPQQTVTLAANSAISLQGAFPEGRDSMQLTLSDDAFKFDNVAPVVRPKRKPLYIHMDTNADKRGIFTKLIQNIPNSHLVSSEESHDTAIRFVTHLEDIDTIKKPSIFALDDQAESKSRPSLDIVASSHELNDGLSWSGLLLAKGVDIASDPARDDPLVWVGAEPIIFMRGPHLVFDFDPASSNADRLPAFILLVNRYLNEIREKKASPEIANCELSQPLQIALPKPDESATISISGAFINEERSFEGAILKAPALPAHFVVSQGDIEIFRGASQFSDARESDFSEAETWDDLEDFEHSLKERLYEADFLASFWLLLVAALFIGNWYACHRENL